MPGASNSHNPRDESKPGPALVPALPRRRAYSVLALWHLLSLDAPSVAAVWTMFIARCAGVRLPWVEPAAMFVAVWMIYAADRLLDARVLDLAGVGDRGIEARHRFHHAHRRGFLAALVVAAFVLVGLLHRNDDRSLHLYALLATLLGVWMLLIHAGGRSRVGGRDTDQRLPKELVVGMFFPAAVFIPTIARLPALSEALLPSAMLFAGLCGLNCLLLYAWEHPERRQGAHWTTRWAIARLDLLAMTLLTACGVLAVVQPGGFGRASALACGLSAGMLCGLDRAKGQMKAIHLRAAADLVLMTPLFWLLR